MNIIPYLRLHGYWNIPERVSTVQSWTHHGNQGNESSENKKTGALWTYTVVSYEPIS